MDVALITPTPPDISAFGIRSLSSFLKEQGHSVKLIFLPGGIDRLEVKGGYTYKYSDHILEDIVRICQDCELIGLSFMTQYFDRARQITNAIKQVNNQQPVVWGGFHPTLCPEESLNYADFVVEGEGEIPLAQLISFLDGKNEWKNVPNTWRRSRDRDEKPSDYYWMNDIDDLPDFDYQLDNHYVIDIMTDHIVRLDDKLFIDILPKMPYFNGKFLTVYRTMSSRGCPHQCSYCINRTLRQRYCQGTYLRRRSVTNVIRELRSILDRFPGINGIHFFDDSFFSNSVSLLEEFAELYQQHVNIPFYCQGSPEAITPKKLSLLIDAGLVFCEMGIQTGSEKIAKLYHRTSTNEQIRRAIQTIDYYRDRLLKPHYHVIVDTPWASTEDDRQTLEMLLSIPHSFMLCLASLTLFPGTELHQKALDEKIIRDEVTDIYRKAFYKPQSSYLNLLITLTDQRLIPRSVLRFLSGPAFIKLFQRQPLTPLWRGLMAIDKGIRYLQKGFESIRYGNFWRLSQFFRKIR